MNQTPLAKPPADAADYVKPPEHCCEPDAVEEWLCEMLQEAKFDLHVSDCFKATVASVAQRAAKAEYRIQYVSIPGSTASADFYLKRLHA